MSKTRRVSRSTNPEAVEIWSWKGKELTRQSESAEAEQNFGMHLHSEEPHSLLFVWEALTQECPCAARSQPLPKLLQETVQHRLGQRRQTVLRKVVARHVVKDLQHCRFVAR